MENVSPVVMMPQAIILEGLMVYVANGRSKEQEMKKQRQQEIKDEAISAIAKKYGCSKEAAEVILKNGDI